MRELERGKQLSLEIYEDDYQGDIHSSLPQAIYRSLEEGQQEYVEAFGIEDLNRVLSEGDRAGSGWIVEDFAISGSRHDGEIVVGQCVSCRSKENNYEEKQVESLLYSLRNFHTETYERMNGGYVVAVDEPMEDVREIEEKVEDEIEEYGLAEVDIIVREIDAEPDLFNQTVSGFFAD
ncbi:MAG: hypothetical protein ABEK04_01635 [Candidatus Nanohalobium sp.]